MGSTVHGLDGVGILLFDQLAFQFHRRRQLFILGAQLGVEQEKLLDLFNPGKLAIDPVDFILYQGLHLWGAGE